MSIKAMINKYREPARPGFAVLLLLISFLANKIWPSIGIPFGGALAVIIGIIAFALPVAVVYMFLDNDPNNGKAFMKLFWVVVAVQILLTWVTPLAEWIIDLVPL